MKKLLTTGPGILIAIPTLGRPVNLEWAMAFKALNPPINFNVNFSIIKGQPVDVARNAFAQQAIDCDAKYLFFLGDDVIVPPHTIRQLIHRMENNPEMSVIGGVYCSKTENPAPLIFKDYGRGAYWDWKIGEVFECVGIGMDCTLIKTEVFKNLPKPYFKTVDTDQYADAINNAESWTEDLYFCRNVLENTESKVFVDTGIICDHFDIYTNRTFKLPKDSLPCRQKVVTKDKKCLMLGSPITLTDDTFDITYVSRSEDPAADYRCSFDVLPFDAKQFDFVVVTEHQWDLVNKQIDEWKRVCKGKLAINLHPLINPDVAAKVLGGKVDGTFVELEIK